MNKKNNEKIYSKCQYSRQYNMWINFFSLQNAKLFNRPRK
jgi:hypothetical protein